MNDATRPTREECIAECGRRLAAARELRDRLSPREAAIAAQRAGAPSVDELEDRIRAERGLDPIIRERAS